MRAVFRVFWRGAPLTFRLGFARVEVAIPGKNGGEDEDAKWDEWGSRVTIVSDLTDVS